MSTDKSEAVTEYSDGLYDAIRARFRERLVQFNVSARAVSRRAGFNVGYLGDFLAKAKSTKPDMTRILKIARELELSPQELGVTADGAPMSYLYNRDTAKEGANVPLYAARIAMNSAWVPVEWKPLDAVPTLPNHSAADGVYAVAVFNDLNAPRYFLGEVILVSPVSPIKVGDFVFVRNAEGLCSIGRLASVDPESATWTLVSNGESVTGKMPELIAFHRIVGVVANG